MRKLLFSLTAAVLGIAALASVALAEGGNGASSDMLQFTGTDSISGGEATWVMPWANNLVDRWGLAYGWRPSQTTTIRFYTDGQMMANDLATFRGSPLSPNDFGYVSQEVGAFTTPDNRQNGPGGFAILVNLNAPQFGGGIGLAPYYRNEVKGAITMQLANMMANDLAGTGGSTWVRTGLVNYLTESEVPGLNAPIQKYVELSNLIGANAAPTMTMLQNNWTGITGTSPMFMDAAIAASTDAVRVLVPQIGVNGVVNLLHQSTTGGDFNAQFMALTGMGLSQFNTAYQTPLMSTINALNNEMAGQTTTTTP